MIRDVPGLLAYGHDSAFSLLRDGETFAGDWRVRSLDDDPRRPGESF